MTFPAELSDKACDGEIVDWPFLCVAQPSSLTSRGLDTGAGQRTLCGGVEDCLTFEEEKEGNAEGLGLISSLSKLCLLLSLEHIRTF